MLWRRLAAGVGFLTLVLAAAIDYLGWTRKGPGSPAGA